MAEPKNIYDLALHEEHATGYWTITRVPGGWIYEPWDEEKGQPKPCLVFVPYCEPCVTLLDSGSERPVLSQDLPGKSD